MTRIPNIGAVVGGCLGANRRNVAEDVQQSDQLGKVLPGPARNPAPKLGTPVVCPKGMAHPQIKVRAKGGQKVSLKGIKQFSKNVLAKFKPKTNSAQASKLQPMRPLQLAPYQAPQFPAHQQMPQHPVHRQTSYYPPLAPMAYCPGQQFQPTKAQILNFSRITHTPQSAQQMIKDDYALLSLAKIHLPKSGSISTADLQAALSKTALFLQGNGPRGGELNQRLSQLGQHIQAHPELRRDLGSKEIKEIVRTLNRGNISKHSIGLTATIGQTNRLDKKETGLAHTLFQPVGANTWFESFKTYDLNSVHDQQAIGQAHHTIFSPQRKVAARPDGKFTSILGKGSFGKVIPARDIKTNEIMAGKKILNLPEARKEFDNGQSLLGRIHIQSKGAFIMAESGMEAQGAANKNTGDRIQKAYLFSPLAAKGDEHSAITANLAAKQQGRHSEFQQRNIEQISLMCDLVSQLEANDIVHPDLKPANIFGGRIGDVGDIISRGEKYDVHTPVYTLPGSQGKTLSGVEFDTFNRYSLGVMIMQSVIGRFPTDQLLPPELRLLSQGLYSSSGYDPATTLIVPDQISGQPLSFYDKAALQFAKTLMSADRNQAHPTNLNLNQWVNYVNAHRV